MKNTTLIAGLLGIVIISGLAYYAFSPDTGVIYTATTTPTTTIKDPVTTIREAGAPIIVTSQSISTSEFAASVSGTVNPHGFFTNYWFEYGPTTSLGSKTVTQNIGSGYTALTSPGYISGLAKNTTYYVRLVAENQYGKVMGTQYSFKTEPGNPAPIGSIPTVKTTAGTGLARTSAVLNGEVTPNKSQTQYWFEYGRTADFGNTSSFQSISNTSSKTSVSLPISNLTPLTNYFYRLNAQNQWGTVNGLTLTFKTDGPSANASPMVDTNSATNVKATTATLRGTVNARELATTYWFQYSTDSLLGTILLKETPHLSAGSSKNDASFESNLSGLVSNTNYFYRIVAENSSGINYGDRVSFKTK